MSMSIPVLILDYLMSTSQCKIFLIPQTHRTTLHSKKRTMKKYELTSREVNWNLMVVIQHITSSWHVKHKIYLGSYVHYFTNKQVCVNTKQRNQPYSVKNVLYMEKKHNEIHFLVHCYLTMHICYCVHCCLVVYALDKNSLKGSQLEEGGEASQECLFDSWKR